MQPPELAEVALDCLERHQADATKWASFVDAIHDVTVWPEERRKITRQLQAALGTMSRCACPACEYVFQQLVSKWWTIHFGGRHG